MASLHILSAAEQVSNHLRDKLIRCVWSETIPGSQRLARELGVGRMTVEAALELLEQEGLLVPQGAGKRRKIVLPRDAVTPTRLGILVYDSQTAGLSYIIQLRQALEEAGHTPILLETTLHDLKMDVKRVARLVGSTDANAWVVCAGSHEVLAWFAGQPLPSFALFGRMEGVPIAGVKPQKSTAVAAATRQLIEIGHRRIVLLTRPERRLPGPGRAERALFDELETHGIQTGTYNLPHWEDSPEGFQAGLASLFQLTPPTALLVDEAYLLAATQQFLARRGIQIPKDVSLICTNNDPAFDWCRPTIAHIDWDPRPVVRRMVRWAANVSQGREDVKQTHTKATFVAGGTVGPVKE
ncbi:MAG: DNA-binding LacI/PurR family transcriptional regulator/biotin operon repressor [Candidatus Omnitrophota bacterium]|jgi:DNA-binding LacI/PurR family transcriptional regulator/biotin operon repressor